LKKIKKSLKNKEGGEITKKSKRHTNILTRKTSETIRKNSISPSK
jgi:hypothetical protein